MITVPAPPPLPSPRAPRHVRRAARAHRDHWDRVVLPRVVDRLERDREEWVSRAGLAVVVALYLLTLFGAALYASSTDQVEAVRCAEACGRAGGEVDACHEEYAVCRVDGDLELVRWSR